MKLIATIDVKERVTHLKQEGFRNGEELNQGLYYLSVWRHYMPCVGKGRDFIRMWIDPDTPSIDLNDVELSLKELQKFCDKLRIDLFIDFPKRMEV